MHTCSIHTELQNLFLTAKCCWFRKANCCKDWSYWGQSTVENFAFKPTSSANQLKWMHSGYTTVHYNVEAEANSMFSHEGSTITMNSDCNDSPSQLVVFLFLRWTCFQQHKHVCALSSGHPSLKWDRPHIPLSTERWFDHCCQAELTHKCGNVLQGVGEICVQAESACDVFIWPMQIEALPHSSNKRNRLRLCDDEIQGSWTEALCFIDFVSYWEQCV